MKLSLVSVEVIDILTCLYILSLVSMCVATNIRPVFVNYWDGGVGAENNEEKLMDLGINHTWMVVNQTVIMVLGWPGGTVIPILKKLPVQEPLGTF